MSIYTDNDFSKMHTNDAWHKLIKFVPEKAKILDIGCSSGHLGQEIKKQKQATVVGIDIDKADIELAKKHLDEALLVNVEKDDLSQLGTFDVIIMADVIEHLVDPIKALKKIKLLLKKDGRLVFSIPNMANVTTRIELLKGRFEYKDFGLLDRTHLHFYDEAEVNRVFQESGLNVVDTDCTIRDIPQPILKKDLEEVGIELTPKLHKYLEETTATIYQFIGFAQTNSHPAKFRGKTSSPLDSVSRQIDEIENSHRKELIQKNKEIEKLGVTIETITRERDEFHNELNGIMNSKGWRVLSKAYKAKNAIHRKNKPGV